jgi:hypothetical protein
MAAITDDSFVSFSFSARACPWFDFRSHITHIYATGFVTDYLTTVAAGRENAA